MQIPFSNNKLVLKYSALIACVFIMVMISGCTDKGDLLTIYSAELRDLETSASLENVSVELWRNDYFQNHLIQTKLTDSNGRFEFAFFSVVGSRHQVIINATENTTTNCNIFVNLNEGEQLHEIKMCKLKEALLNVSLSEESKLLQPKRIFVHVKNLACTIDFETDASSELDNYNRIFQVFPDSKYTVSFSLYNDQNQIFHSGTMEVEFKKEVITLFL